MNPKKLAKRYCVTNGKKFRLKDYLPSDKDHLKSVKDFAPFLGEQTEHLQKLQDKLYADGKQSLLLIFQAMDAAGKDGTIKHVMSGVNPQGCSVHSFKAPGPHELAHDYLWRASLRLPERGRIGIFNRSYYEDVLVVRVHPEILHKSRLPEKCITKDIWKERFEDIRAFERYLTRNGVKILKFFLNVSQDEQRKRFLARCEDPKKNWKFSDSDMKERAFWKDYMNAFEDTIRHTASKEAPWYVVPADDKFYTHLVVSAAITEALKEMDLSYPKVGTEKLGAIEVAKAKLRKA